MIKHELQQAKEIITNANHVLILQAENPDGDSLGSALTLEEICAELGKKITLYCASHIPSYLHYIPGWDRVTQDFPNDFDAAIIVDASTQSLFAKTLSPENSTALAKRPLIIFDHHADTKEADHLQRRFEHILLVNDPSHVATGTLLADWALTIELPITPQAAENMIAATLADSLGLTSQATNAKTVFLVSQLMELGGSIAAVESRRREFMKKSPRILHYKGALLQRIEYHLGGQLATVHIPWGEIEEYSPSYNPSALIIDEMRLVEGVEVAIALKSYPDGKITAKIRSNLPIAGKVAMHFDGGGNPYAAGLKLYSDNFSLILQQLVKVVDKQLQEYHKTTTTTQPC